MVACPETLDKVQLLFAGVDSGLPAAGCDPVSKLVTFELNPARSKTLGGPAWKQVFGGFWQIGAPPKAFPASIVIPVANGAAPVTEGFDLMIQMNGRRGLFFTIAFIVLALLCVLGKFSGMLRDSNAQTIGNHRPYSLSRVQMAWWFAIVITCAIGLAFITGSWPTMGPTALALLGVSGATGVAAAGIDSTPKRAVGATEWFIPDILTDANGITLARFQLLAWNVCLGIYYLQRVATEWALPELDTTTLGLLGLSAATYVGMKVPEKHS